MEAWLRKARFHPPTVAGTELLAELDRVLDGRDPTPQEALEIALALANKRAPDLLDRAGAMAQTAHRAGLPDAGLLYAETVDRRASMRGPWQGHLRPLQRGRLRPGAGQRLPERYGAILAFSGAGGAGRNLRTDSPVPPCFLVAGTMERGFLEETRAVARHQALRGVERLLRERVAGHDLAMWEEEFPRAVDWALGRRQGPPIKLW